MIYEYVMSGELDFTPSHLLESMIDENDDLETLCEKADNLIGKVVDSINTLVKRLVKSFDDLMKKNKTEKTIKELEKLPKNTKVDIGIDIDEAGKTYNDLIDEYSATVNDPKKSTKIKEKTERAKSRRKKILVASTVTVGAILFWLKLLKDKNNFKNYRSVKKASKASDRIFDIKSDMYVRAADLTGKKLNSAVKYRDILDVDSRTKDPKHQRSAEDYEKIKKHYKYYNDKKAKEATEIYTKYLESERALQESEYYRLTLYRNILKSVKSIGKFVKGTVIYGLKGGLVPYTSDDDVTAAKKDLKRDITELNKTRRSRVD